MELILERAERNSVSFTKKKPAMLSRSRIYPANTSPVPHGSRVTMKDAPV